MDVPKPRYTFSAGDRPDPRIRFLRSFGDFAPNEWLACFRPPAEIPKPRPPTLGEPIRQPATAPFCPFKKALPGQAEQIAVNGAAIERPTKPQAQFVRCKESVRLRECR